MKNSVIISLIMLVPLIGTTQSLDRWVIGSTGDYEETGSMSLSYTVGEPSVETEETPSIVLTQGFQQSRLEAVDIEAPSLDLAIKAYPNPTQSKVLLEMNARSVRELQLTLFDEQGRSIEDRELRVKGQQTEVIDMSELSSGIYYIRLRDRKGRSRSIGIEKVR